MNEKDIIILTLGVFFLKILTKILKKMINQNRPNNKKDGMPSFCGAFTLYIATYIFLNSNLNYKTYFSILVFVFGLQYSKYYMNEHNVYQLLFGSFIGFLFANIVNFIK